MESLIKELNELQATLKADGYKDWCYAQLTIDKAIKVVKNCTIPLVSNLLCGLFEPKNDSSSATICKHCGREKWMHPKAT